MLNQKIVTASIEPIKFEKLNMFQSQNPQKEEKKLNLTDEMNSLLKNEVASRHSYFQLKYFLIGKEPTNQAKMWQCLRELKIRKESLSSLALEVEENKDNIELLENKINKSKLKIQTMDEFDIKELEITNRKNTRKIQSIKEKLDQLQERKKFLEEECKFFVETFKNIEKIEPLKPFDDFNSQKEYWGEKFSQKLNLKMLTNNQLDSELVESIVALPDDIPIKKQMLTTLNVRHEYLTKTLTETINRIENAH
jgi:hypothetical protein